MQSEHLNEALVDLVDGRLDGAEQRQAERHLEACADCRALIEDLRSIRAAAFMLDRRAPKAETWSKVQAAIAAEPLPKGRLLDMTSRRGFGGRTNWAVWLGAAAALILATVIGLLPLMNRTELPQDSAPAEAAAEAEVTV